MLNVIEVTGLRSSTRTVNHQSPTWQATFTLMLLLEQVEKSLMELLDMQ